MRNSYAYLLGFSQN